MNVLIYIPLRLPKVEVALLGQAATQQTLERVVKLASEGAKPLPQQYKVEPLKRTVLEALKHALNS